MASGRRRSPRDHRRPRAQSEWYRKVHSRSVVFPFILSAVLAARRRRPTSSVNEANTLDAGILFIIQRWPRRGLPHALACGKSSRCRYHVNWLLIVLFVVGEPATITGIYAQQNTQCRRAACQAHGKCGIGRSPLQSHARYR